MGMQEDVIFELDSRTGEAVFYQTGLWGSAMQTEVGLSYLYQPLMDKFIKTFVKGEYQKDFSHLLNFQTIFAASGSKKPLRLLEGQILNPDSGEYEWYHINTIPSSKEKCFCIIQNVQANKERELRLQHSAAHDSLTNLLNRTAFRKAVEASLKQETKGIFLIIDVDNFKQINDMSGHASGDQVLVQIAAHLRRQLPREAIIGRFGGDEFQVFIPKMMIKKDLDQLCTGLSHMPDELQPQFISVSIGVSLCPQHALGLEDLFRCADQALYAAKRIGKNRTVVFYRELADPKNEKTYSSSQKTKRSPFQRLLNLLRQQIVGIVFLLLFAGLGIFFVAIHAAENYTKSIQKETESYLYEISSQINANASTRLESWLDEFAVIGQTVATLQGHSSEAEVEDYLAQIDFLRSFSKASAIDEQGNWHSPDGPPMEMTEYDAALSRCVEKKETFFTDAILYEGTEYIACFTPLPLQTSDGVRFVALGGLIEADKLKDSLILTAFGNMAFAEILSPDGSTVLRSDNSNSILAGENLFDSLDKVRLLSPSPEEVRENFSKRQSGIFRYEYQGQEYISLYSRLRNQAWILYTTIPANVLAYHTAESFHVLILGCIAIMFLFVALMLTLFIQQVKNRRALGRIAFTDPVTGGYNRAKFMIDVRSYLTKKKAAYSLLYLNIDHFKLINDRLGTDKANELLKIVQQCINQHLTNRETSCRLAADHFALLLATQNEGEITGRIRLLRQSISESYFVQNNQCSLSLSFGVYEIDDPELSVDILIDRSNLARQSARYGNNIGFYDEKLRERLLLERQLEDRMHSALKNGEYVPYLQPKYASDTGKMIGFEALARWIIPDQGLVYPDSFIPLFERNGFIVNLDLYIFEQCCRILHNRLIAGKSCLPISFNVSRAHFADENLLKPYIAIWKEYNVPASYLEFEFTESLVYENVERFNEIISELHRYGFICSIDDFGSGYSSLNMLHELNVDVVKIDQKFLSDGPVLGEKSRLIIKNVVSLIQQLGMKAIAEGVEYTEHVEFLKYCGCNYLQGYYFNKPMPENDVMQLIDREEEINPPSEAETSQTISDK